jgi:hypothetical protein
VKQIDVQDILLVVGCICLIVGAGMIYRPAALIVAGALFLAMVYMIERTRAAQEHSAAKEKRGPSK